MAEMKAVILSNCPEANIVDISHGIEKFNIRMGAFVLACAAPYFPKDTIHVAVVDPGVGTKRKPILIRTKQACFIGPDNGILALAAGRKDTEPVYEIANKKLIMSQASNTFHGRDIFASAAAHLAKGTLPTEFGQEIREIVTPSFAKIVRKKDVLIGEVIHIDDFGNVITNFREKELELAKAENVINIEHRKTKLTFKRRRAYADAGKHQPMALIGSHRFLEISLNQGNAAKHFKIRNGDQIIVCHS